MENLSLELQYLIVFAAIPYCLGYAAGVSDSFAKDGPAIEMGCLGKLVSTIVLLMIASLGYALFSGGKYPEDIGPFVTILFWIALGSGIGIKSRNFIEEEDLGEYTKAFHATSLGALLSGLVVDTLIMKLFWEGNTPEAVQMTKLFGIPLILFSISLVVSTLTFDGGYLFDMIDDLKGSFLKTFTFVGFLSLITEIFFSNSFVNKWLWHMEIAPPIEYQVFASIAISFYFAYSEN